MNGKLIYAQPPLERPSQLSQEEFESAFNPLLTARIWYQEQWAAAEEAGSQSIEHLSVTGERPSRGAKTRRVEGEGRRTSKLDLREQGEGKVDKEERQP